MRRREFSAGVYTPGAGRRRVQSGSRAERRRAVV